MTSTVYDNAKKKLVDGSINLVSDTLKVALCTSSYIPNVQSHVFFSDITNEIVVSGYTAGGAALTGQAVTVDTGNNRAYLSAGNTSWAAGATMAARYAILYKSTGTAGTSPLIGYIDFVTDRTVQSGETFFIQWAATSAGGILYLA